MISILMCIAASFISLITAVQKCRSVSHLFFYRTKRFSLVSAYISNSSPNMGILWI